MARKKSIKSEKGTAKWWLDEIKLAKKVKEAWMERFDVQMAYDFFDGNQRPDNWPKEFWITVNMIYSNILAELPTLYSTDPYFYIKLKASYKPEPMTIALYEQRATIRQAMLNYLKSELRMKNKSRVCILDAMFQYGIMKVMRQVDLEENPDAGNPLLDENFNQIIVDGEPLLEPELLPTNKTYQLKRIHPTDFLVDPDAGPLNEEVRWKAEKIKRDVEEVRNDIRYSSKARKNVQASEFRQESDKAREQRQKSGQATKKEEGPEAEIVVIWEIHDLKKGEMLAVAEGCNEFLIRPTTEQDGVEGDPYVDLRFTLRPDSWYPLPPVSQWIDPQSEYNQIRSKVLEHRKKFNRKYEAFEQGLSDAEDALEQLESGADGTVIKTKQQGQIIHPIKDAPLDQAVHMEIGYIRGDFQEVAVGANQRGARSGVDSATEAGILEKRTQVREGDRLSLVGDFAVDQGRKIDQLVQTYITEDQAVKVSGPQGEAWQIVRTGDYEAIAGEFEYSVNVGASTPMLPEIERAQWLAFIQLAVGAPWILLSKRFTTKMAELHNIYDEAMVEELREIAKMIVQQQQEQGGQMPQPGSVGGISVTNPQSVSGGLSRGGTDNFGGV